jgi:Type II CAAX prenyl endopeptidase Rce1-like
VSGLGEEIGWTGFALPRLLRLTGSPVLSAALLGSYYVVWPIVPFLETGHSVPWVLAQCAQAFLLRCTIAGLCAGSLNKVWMAVVVHGLSNLAWSTAPSGGAYYDPAFVDLLLLPVAVASLAAGHFAWTGRHALSCTMPWPRWPTGSPRVGLSVVLRFRPAIAGRPEVASSGSRALHAAVKG